MLATALKATTLMLLALAGCAAAGGGDSAQNFYACVPEGADANAPPSQTVSLQALPDRAGLALRLGRQEDILQPVGEASGRVYAGQSYAWRVGDPDSKLIDIAAVRSFACRPIAAAVQASR